MVETTLIKKAESDLKTVEILLTDSDAPNEVICFHCQQAVEKYLKAFLDHNHIDFPKTHDLKNLLDACIKLDSTFSQLIDIVDLTTFAVQSRYDEGYYLGREETEEYVDLTQKSVIFIRSKLGL